MEKKLYQAPYTEQIYMDMSSRLLDVFSLDVGDVNDPDNDGIAGAKQNTFDDEYFLDDEGIEPVWSFNVWE